jgi:hypothetical protein
MGIAFDLKQIEHKTLKPEEVIQYAYINIGPIWLGKLYSIPDLVKVFSNSRTELIECVVTKLSVWKEISRRSFVPYVDVNRWSKGIFSLKEFLSLPSTKDDTRFNRLQNNNEVKIVTAYHNLIKKRIIVDGFHRAVALENEIKGRKRKSIPPIRIWECYGNLVHTIFPFEFSHLMKSLS